MEQGPAAPNGAAPDGRGVRERLLGAMLEASGELGFEHVRQSDVEERAGVGRGAFGENFTGKEECFALAYDLKAADLSLRMLEAGRQGPFRSGLRAALREALRYLSERPALARAMLVEVNAAGPQAWLAQRQAMAQLSVALDRAARQVGGADGAPAITAGHVVGGVVSMIRTRVARGETDELERLEPDLVDVVMLQFFPAGAVAGDSAAVF